MAFRGRQIPSTRPSSDETLQFVQSRARHVLRNSSRLSAQQPTPAVLTAPRIRDRDARPWPQRALAASELMIAQKCTPSIQLAPLPETKLLTKLTRHASKVMVRTRHSVFQGRPVIVPISGPHCHQMPDRQQEVVKWSGSRRACWNGVEREQWANPCPDLLSAWSHVIGVTGEPQPPLDRALVGVAHAVPSSLVMCDHQEQVSLRLGLANGGVRAATLVLRQAP